MKSFKGIDVSGYQGKIDWHRVKKAGVEFAILKVIRKDLNSDKQFENNWAGCLAAGVPIQGVYHYTYATNVGKAMGDARKVLEILGQDRHPFVWQDWEDKSLPTGRLAADIINAYGDVITAGGCDFGIYFGMSYYDSYLDKIMKYIKPLYQKGWEARYYNGYKLEMRIADPVNTDKKPANFDGKMFGWQYTSMGRVDGIGGYVDLNQWFVDIEAAAGGVSEENVSYQLADFIKESRGIWNVPATASAKEIVNKTVTVGTSRNRSHTIVTPLERYMKALGYYTGSIEADRGMPPVYGNGMRKAIILYQTNMVKASAKNQDGILTAGGATWRRLYGIA